MLKLQAIGNLGKDAIVKESVAGSCALFSIAHTEKWRDSQGVIKERTNWVSCALWDKEALHPYLKQGIKVYVEGMPFADTYTNNEGKVVAKLVLRVFNIELCGHPKNKDTSNGATSSAPADSTTAYSGDDPTDDLPF